MRTLTGILMFLITLPFTICRTIGRIPLALDVATFPLALPPSKRDPGIWSKSLKTAFFGLFRKYDEIVLLELQRVKRTVQIINKMPKELLERMRADLAKLAEQQAIDDTSNPNAPAPPQAASNRFVC